MKACVIAMSMAAIVAALPWSAAHAQAGGQPADLDAQVRAFLDRTRGDWRDLNVPYEDGQALYDLVLSKGFTRGLEIGTSTGHSAIWIA